MKGYVTVSEAPFEAERDRVQKDHASGLLSNEEYNQQMTEIDTDERDAFREAAEINAEQAYRDTVGG